MRIVDDKQTWKGFFTYLHTYEPFDTYIEVAFSLDLTFNGNSFIGTSIDKESENIFTESVIVKGFIENDLISFVKKYPYHYYIDEDGNFMVDKDLEHPNIEYLGFYNQTEEKYIGTWEMIVSEQKISEDNYREEVVSGEFGIYREK